MRPNPLTRLFLAAISTSALIVLPATGNAQVPAPRSQPASAGKSLQGHYLTARVAEEDHDYDKSADEFDQALAMAPSDPDLIYSAFRVRLYAGRFDGAALLAPAVLAIKPGDGLANLVLAIQQIRRGDYRTAELQISRIGAENQLGPLRDYVMAWLKAGEKEFVPSREYLAKLQPEPGKRAEAPALIIQAQIDEMAGDKPAAEAKYLRAAKLDPGGLRTVLAVADGLRRVGKAQEAMALLKDYGARYSDSVVMDGLLSPSAPMPRLPTAASGIADILFDIGGILGANQRAQQADLALIFLQLSIELRPDNDFAWLTLSGLYEQFENVPKAIVALGKIAPSSPIYWQARLRAATLDAQEGHVDQAIARLRSMVAEKADRIDAALALADLMRSKERYADAVTAYSTAISRLKQPEERHWAIYFGRGIVLERVKQWPRAEADMKKALELSPDQPYVLNYLGYSWIDQGMHLQDGMKMLMRATELKPDDGAITDSVGWAYYRLGQFDKAVEWLERASEQKGDDATIVEHLGDAYWHVGRKREARFEWQRALNQKPEKDRMPILQDKLSNGLSSANDKPTVYEKAADRKQGG
jgi:tetratricopeptide (TPR) repeat protein